MGRVILVAWVLLWGVGGPVLPGPVDGPAEPELGEVLVRTTWVHGCWPLPGGGEMCKVESLSGAHVWWEDITPCLGHERFCTQRSVLARTDDRGEWVKKLAAGSVVLLAVDPPSCAAEGDCYDHCSSGINTFRVALAADEITTLAVEFQGEGCVL